MIAMAPPALPTTFALMGDTIAIANIDGLLPLEDPAYASLVEQTLSTAPSLSRAISRIGQARARAGMVGAERRPNIGVDITTAASRLNPDQFGLNLPPDIRIDSDRLSYGASLIFSWDVDLFGRLQAHHNAATANLDAATAEAAAVRNVLLAEIASSVIDWRTLAARQAALESDLKAAEELVKLAYSRERAGIAPEFDRIRAASGVAASQSRIAALENERTWVVGRLVSLTGTSAQSILMILESPWVGGPSMPPPASVPSDMLARRPDIQAAAANLVAADANLAAAAAQRFPRLTLSGALGLLAFNPSQVFSDRSVVGLAQGSLLAPLLDFGRIEGEIDSAAADKVAAFANYRDVVFGALGDAETAYGLVTATDHELAAAIEEAETSGRAARLAEMRHRAGLSDFLTVLEARRTSDASGERAAAAAGRAQRARVLLWRVLGGSPQQEPRHDTAIAGEGDAVDAD